MRSCVTSVCAQSGRGLAIYFHQCEEGGQFKIKKQLQSNLAELHILLDWTCKTNSGIIHFTVFWCGEANPKNHLPRPLNPDPLFCMFCSVSWVRCPGSCWYRRVDCYPQFLLGCLHCFTPTIWTQEPIMAVLDNAHVSTGCALHISAASQMLSLFLMEV